MQEQLQRRDLHLDLLRRKLSLQEDCVHIKAILQSERDEANLRYGYLKFVWIRITLKLIQHMLFVTYCRRIKKLLKQQDRLHIQLAEEKTKNREISAQLTEAANYKVSKISLEINK